MRPLISLCLLFAFTLPLAAEEDFLGWRISDFKEKTYRFKITKSALAKAPQWRKDQANPPLPARDACATALAQAKTLRPEVMNWKAASLSLTPVGTDDEGFNRGQWIYLVTLQDFSGPLAGVPHALNIPVYLDGSTIQPEIMDRK